MEVTKYSASGWKQCKPKRGSSNGKCHIILTQHTQHPVGKTVKEYNRGFKWIISFFVRKAVTASALTASATNQSGYTLSSQINYWTVSCSNTQMKGSLFFIPHRDSYERDGQWFPCCSRPIWKHRLFMEFLMSDTVLIMDFSKLQEGPAPKVTPICLKFSLLFFNFYLLFLIFLKK